MPDENLIPDEYGKILELHKFYMELGTKAAAGSLTVIGAILAYTTENRAPTGPMQLALVVPVVMSLGNAVVFTMAAYFGFGFVRQVRVAQARVGAHWRPQVELLLVMTAVAAALFLLLTLVLAWALRDPSVLSASGPA